MARVPSQLRPMSCQHPHSPASPTTPVKSRTSEYLRNHRATSSANQRIIPRPIDPAATKNAVACCHGKAEQSQPTAHHGQERGFAGLRKVAETVVFRDQLPVARFLDLAYPGVPNSEGTPAFGDLADDPSGNVPAKEWCAEITRQKQHKEDRRRRQQEIAARADPAWERAARVTREALSEVTRSPKQAGAKRLGLSEDIAERIAQGQEVVLRLIGDKLDSR